MCGSNVRSQVQDFRLHIFFSANKKQWLIYYFDLKWTQMTCRLCLFFCFRKRKGQNKDGLNARAFLGPIHLAFEAHLNVTKLFFSFILITFFQVHQLELGFYLILYFSVELIVNHFFCIFLLYNKIKELNWSIRVHNLNREFDELIKY
jgi:hypothetical protein